MNKTAEITQTNGRHFVSVVTVCKNEGRNIRATCESIAAQSFAEYEWIVIDDGSIDGTLDILAEYRSRINILVSEPDEGIYDAMNKAVALAAGKYVIFLNGGDYFADDDALLVAFRAPQQDILYGDVMFVDDNGSSRLQLFPDRLGRYPLLRHKLPHQATFIRRTLFEKYGNYDTSYAICADYDLLVRFLYVHKASYFHLPRPISVFRTNGTSSREENRLRHVKENHRVRKTYFPWFAYWRRGLRTERRIRRLHEHICTAKNLKS